MQGSLLASTDASTAVLTSYITGAAIMTAPVGWLAARFGRKYLFITCLIGFTAASMLCGAAQYEGALERMNRALEIETYELSYSETRGQLQVKRGRHADAIQDLEFVLNGMGDVAEVHLALANAYEKMGQAEQAEAHRRRAQ